MTQCSSARTGSIPIRYCHIWSLSWLTICRWPTLFTQCSGARTGGIPIRCYYIWSLSRLPMHIVIWHTLLTRCSETITGSIPLIRCYIWTLSWLCVCPRHRWPTLLLQCSTGKPGSTVARCFRCVTTITCIQFFATKRCHFFWSCL